MKNNQSGFTLIEIVMVLVLLGILSAVAAPKYFDLRDQAEAQSAKTVGAEYQARLNAKFASELLNKDGVTTAAGNTCEGALTAAKAEAKLLAETTAFTVGTLGDATDGVAVLPITSKTNTTKTYNFNIAIPKCN